MVERGIYYCSDMGFCGKIGGTIMGQMVNTEAKGSGSLQSSLDQSAVPQQEAYQRLISQRRLEIGNSQHAEGTIKGYSWLLGQLEIAR